MEPRRSTSLSDAARSHWRSFLPAWVFPFVFFYGGSVSDSLGHPNLFFFAVAMPLFYWSSYRAAAPWLRKSIKYWHCFFWAMVVPFFLGIVAVTSRLALLSLLAGNGKA
jgi:hypothetical protein